jgi:hypothetical protein
MRLTTRKDVKMLFIQRDLTPSRLATELGTSSMSIYSVIAGKMQSKRIREHLEKRTGVKMDALTRAWNRTALEEGI